MVLRKIIRKTKLVSLLALGLILTPFSCCEAKEADAGSGASRDGDIISIDEEFTASDGHNYKVIMTGLREDNKAAMLQALADNYDSADDDPLKIKDSSFVDAEKWDCKVRSCWQDIDNMHCWLASISNMVWMSGWAKEMTNPKTGAKFTSEDEVFDYASRRFGNAGGDIDTGIEWLFTGEVYIKSPANHSTPLCEDTNDGLMRDIYIADAVKKYDLIEDASQIGQLERISKTEENSVVFGGDIGSDDGGKLFGPIHALTIAGLITDPAADTPEGKYKAIILVDSDNDAKPTDAQYAEDERLLGVQDVDDPDVFPEPENVEKQKDYRAGVKEQYTNSFTVYKLRYAVGEEGQPYWVVENYSDTPYALYDFFALSNPTPETISSCTETEGTMDVFQNVDLGVTKFFTTDRTEKIWSPYSWEIEEAKKYSFESGEPVNLHFFLGNRAQISLDEFYPDGNKVTLEWTVTNDADGTVVSKGTKNQLFELFQGTEAAELIELNSELARWDPGAYTVTLRYNADRKITESYYLNDRDIVVHFTVTGDGEKKDDDPGKKDDSDDSPEESTTEQSTTETPKEEKVTTEEPTTEAGAPQAEDKKSSDQKGRSGNIKTPETGDENNLVLGCVLFIISFFGVLGVIFVRKIIKQ